jgi:hypothetical protein
MRCTGPDSWMALGVSAKMDASYTQDDVQQYVNQRADPYVELTLRHIDVDGCRIVIVQVDGCDDLPIESSCHRVVEIPSSSSLAV